MSILNSLKSYVDGDIKTQIKVNISDKEIVHKEGDIWEEGDKSWTIKNGIKLSISKLDSLREELLVPITCPKCKKAMTKRLDPTFYTQFNMCMDCRIQLDTEMIINGEFKQYEQDYISKNKISWFKDLKENINDYINHNDSKHLVNEFGDTEDWASNMNKEELKEILNTQLTQIENKLFDKAQ